nr:5-deoxy-glucuronate isomerase [Propionicimonas sp.]
MSQWVYPAGTSADAEYDTRVLPGSVEGWAHTGLQVADLAAGESRTVETHDLEYIVVPLRGAASVEVAGQAYELAGRPDVFSAATDVLYVPRDASFTLTSTTGGRYALCSATARNALPVAYVPASAVPDELRGAGTASRRVRNFGTPGVLEADSIIACEVITPAGNWSSYPPHKHDEERDGVETSLEEIYYFELRTEPGSPAAGDAFGYQRVYGTDERPIDVLAEVRPRDVVLVPHGWHGPAMAPPGYDMYYLNVMAGPGETRAWLICDDPAHAWVRQTWAGQAVDPRLATTE